MKLPATLLCLLGFSLAGANPVPAPRLLDIANAHWAPATLSNSVLVIVDAQQEYAEGRLPLPGVHAATAEIARAKEAALRAEARTWYEATEKLEARSRGAALRAGLNLAASRRPLHVGHRQARAGRARAGRPRRRRGLRGASAGV